MYISNLLGPTLYLQSDPMNVRRKARLAIGKQTAKAGSVIALPLLTKMSLYCVWLSWLSTNDYCYDCELYKTRKTYDYNMKLSI
jgi:hypothetical protein